MHRQRGFSLVEIILMVLIAGVLIFLLASLPNSVNLIGRGKNFSIAREIAAKKIEEYRTSVYSSLPGSPYPNEINFTSSEARCSLLPQGSCKAIFEECPSTICTTDEERAHAKMTTIIIDWKETGKLQTYKVQTLISEYGL